MISLPDFKEKQILFVNNEWGKSAHLRFNNDNIVFEKDEEVVNRVSVHKTFAVFILGDLSLTTNFIKNIKEHGVSIFLLKNNFELYGSFAAVAEGHYLLRMKQYALTEQREFEMAKNLVANKIANQIALLRTRAIDDVVRSDLIERDEKYQKSVRMAETDEILLGIEGSASRIFYKEYFMGIKWLRRAPRTKEDITNLLMDMGYTFLFNFVDSLLRLHGFDTYKGFYHKLFFQRRSLACDIMEPYRCLVDRQIMKSYNLKQINEADFKFLKGAYQLSFDKHSKYAQIFLQCIMDSKEEIFSYVHGFYRSIMDEQKNEFPYFKLPV